MISKLSNTVQQLLETDPKQVVKVSALVRKLRHMTQAFPELEYYSSDFHRLESAIKESDVDQYQSAFQKLAGKLARKNQLQKLALTGNRVPYQKNQLSEVEFAEALKEGYKEAFGGYPNMETLAGAWAQATLESGRPIRLPNNNIGNIKATKGWIQSGNPYFVKDTREFTQEGEEYVEKETKWRAYPTPEAGAVGYWNLIGKNYRRAMDWMSAGDPESAAAVLGVKGYYTASPQKYAGAVGRLYKYFMKNIAPKISDLESKPTPPPGEKPTLKEWVSQYSPEEKKAILEGKKPIPERLEEELSSDEIDRFLERLKAARRPLTNLVKKSQRQNNQVVVTLGSSGPKVAKIELARIIATAIRQVYPLQTTIYSSPQGQVELVCQGKCSHQLLKGALQEISAWATQVLEKKAQVKVFPIVITGRGSDLESLGAEEIISNRKKFHLWRMTK